MYNKKAVWAFILSLSPIYLPLLVFLFTWLYSLTPSNDGWDALGAFIIFSLIAIFLIFVSLITSLALAISSLKEFDSAQEGVEELKGKGLSITAIVLAGLFIIGFVLLIIILLSGIASSGLYSLT